MSLDLSIEIACAAVVCVAAWWRVETLVRAFITAHAREREREYNLRERELVITERVKAEPREPEPIPPDLMALVLRESEAFAQDDILKVIRQTYAETQDWNMARRAVGRTAFRDPGVGVQ